MRLPPHFCRLGIFLGTQFQKIGKFHLQKITGSLQIFNFYFLFAETFLILYIKEQSTKRKFEKNICLIFLFYFRKMGKTVYDLYKVKINIILNVSQFLALKKSKNMFPLSQA